MIVCKVCGNRNNDQEEFCTSCGRYLAWSGEHVDVAPESEPALAVPEEAEEAGPRPGTLRRLALKLRLIAPPSPPRSAPAPSATPIGVVVPATAPARVVPAAELVPAVAGELGSGRSDAVLVVPEVVGEDGQTAPAGVTMLAGAGSGVTEMRPRRPGDAVPSLPVLPPLPGKEPPPSERATMLRRPTEVTRQSRPRRGRSAAVVTELVETPSPGDVFCSNCGQFNSPRRTYCRRCGHDMRLVVATDDLAYEPLSWWQRHLRRDVRVVAAGDRPGRWGKIVSGAGSQGRSMRIITRVGGVVIAALILLSVIGPYASPIRGWYTRTWHAVYNTVEAKEVGVSATSATASSSQPGDPAFFAVDGHDNTYWESAVVPAPAKAKTTAKAKAKAKAKTGGGAVSAGLPTTQPAVTGSKGPGKTAGAKPSSVKARPPQPPGVGQVLTVQFAPAVSINRLAWLSGASGNQFGLIGRPHRVELYFGRGRHVVESLQDSPSLQTFGLSAGNLSTLRVKILSVYPGSVRAVAITEIEFFHRS